MADIVTQSIYGALILALVTGGGGTAYYFTAGAGVPAVVSLDSDLCRTDGTLDAHRVVLLDTSDKLSDDERKLVRGVIDRDAIGAASYEKMTVVAMEPVAYAQKRLFSACAPKKASDAKGFSENPMMYGAIWRHKFGAPLDGAIDGELAKGPYDHSPIVETIWAISRFYDFGPDVRHRRLDIASDMLQNTPDFSQYRGTPSFKAYEHTEFGRLHMPNLENVQVVVHYLVRPGTLGLQANKKHIQFWKDFFKVTGASAVEFDGVP